MEQRGAAAALGELPDVPSPSGVAIVLDADAAAAFAELAAGHGPAVVSPLLRAALGKALTRAGVLPTSACDALSPLPLEVVVAVAAQLPVDQRLLLALVSRAFRALAAEPGVWRVVDLSPASGVRLVSAALLRAAAAKAAGSIVTLDLTNAVDETEGPLSFEAVEEARRPTSVTPRHAAHQRRAACLWLLAHSPPQVVAANARSLRRLVLLTNECLHYPSGRLTRLLTSAPGLTSVEADVGCTAAASPAVLRNEAPFGSVRLRKLLAQDFLGGEADVLGPGP